MSFFKINNKRINQDSREASLPHLAFVLQIKQNHGLHYVALLSHPQPGASATKRYAPATAQANMFCLISSEAYLLSGRKK